MLSIIFVKQKNNEIVLSNSIYSKRVSLNLTLTVELINVSAIGMQHFV